MTEEELLTGLLDLLALTGWRAYHVRRSDRAIVQGRGGEGFPDIVAVQAVAGTRARMIAIEVKGRNGIPSPEQFAWIFALRQHGTIEATIVRPQTYDAALAWIQGDGPMPSWSGVVERAR